MASLLTAPVHTSLPFSLSAPLAGKNRSSPCAVPGPGPGPGVGAGAGGRSTPPLLPVAAPVVSAPDPALSMPFNAACSPGSGGGQQLPLPGGGEGACALATSNSCASLQLQDLMMLGEPCPPALPMLAVGPSAPFVAPGQIAGQIAAAGGGGGGPGAGSREPSRAQVGAAACFAACVLLAVRGGV